MCCQFPRFFRVIIKKNLSISVILDNFSFSSWNLNFYRNLTNLEIKDLERLVSSLNHVHLSSSFADVRGWSLPFSGLFLVIFIFFIFFYCLFVALSNLSNLCPFSLAKLVWKSKALTKVKACVWLVVHKR